MKTTDKNEDLISQITEIRKRFRMNLTGEEIEFLNRKVNGVSLYSRLLRFDTEVLCLLMRHFTDIFEELEESDEDESDNTI